VQNKNTTKSKSNDSKSEASSLIEPPITTTRKNNNSSAGWAGYHCSFVQDNSIKELILLNSYSTNSAFCNSKYVSNIRKAHTVFKLGTNSGPKTSDMICDL
jgi:hypothetical protein